MPITLLLAFLKLGKCSVNPLRNQVLFFRSRVMEEFRWNIPGQTKSTLVYIKAVNCKNGLQNLLAEDLIFSFALQTGAQSLDTILHHATQCSVFIMIGKVMAKCFHRHHFIDRCSVGIVPLARKVSGSSGNSVEIMRDTIDGIPLPPGMPKSCIDLAAILVGIDGHTFITRERWHGELPCHLRLFL